MQHRSHSVASTLGLVLMAAVLGAPFALGCGDDGESGGRTPTDSVDAGASPPVGDAAAGAFTDAMASTDGGPARDHEDEDPDGAGCFDFVDGDDDGDVDCDDDDCAAAPVCCVGSSSEACCRPGAPRVVAFSACEGEGASALLACAPGATLFGSPSPELRERALIPNGGERYDSGLVLDGAVDPRVARLVLDATVVAGERCESCMDSVAVGVTSRGEALGATSLVEADLALMISTSRGEARLLVGGAVARSIALEEIAALTESEALAPIVYRLETSTTGTVTVSAATREDGPWRVLFGGVRFAPRGAARVVAWGRSTNRGPTDPPAARITRLAVSESVCDAPASLARTDGAILPDAIDGWWSTGASASAPSIATWADDNGARRARMAFVYQGRIHAAGGIDGGRYRALADPREPASALLVPGGAPWMAAGVSDPMLVRGADHRFRLWFTGVAADGTTSIGRADAAAPDSLAFGTITHVLGPSTDVGTVGWDAPSILTTRVGGAERTLLAARRRASDGHTEIALFALDAAGAATPADTTTFDGAAGEIRTDDHVVRRATGRAADFDGDEVAAPALVEYAGVLRLYYAGRRGTRWSIGVMLSQDGVHWREANEGRAVLAGAGAGFDALSTSDPAPIVEDGELRLYYAGTDGVRGAIGLARHLVPEEVAP